MVRDKITGAPRALAFLHCRSVEDAAKLVNRLNGAVFEGQTTPMHATFGLDKGAVASAASSANAVPDAVLV